MWPLLAYFPFPWPMGPELGFPMFHHLSAPSRAARQKVSSAEHWKATSPNWDPNTRTRSSWWTTWPLSWRSRASWRRPGWGLWGAERWLSWHCREEGISHVARTRRVSFLFPVSPEQFGNVNWCLGWCTDRFWFEFDGEAFLAREPFEIECWTALLLVNLLWNYWVNHQRHGPSKSEGLDYLTILSGGKYRSVSWHLVLNSKSARWLGIVFFSPLVQCGLCWLFFLSMTHGAWAGVPHVSTPQRSISSRQAEGLHRRALEGKESQLGPQHPDTLLSVHNLAMLLRKQGKLEEAGPRSLGCWHCREEGISHVAGTRRVSLLFPVSPEQFGNVNWCLGWCTDRFWFEFDGEAFLARGNRLKLSVGQHCCWWIYCEIIGLTTKDTGQASQKALTIWLS